MELLDDGLSNNWPRLLTAYNKHIFTIKLYLAIYSGEKGTQH